MGFKPFSGAEADEIRPLNPIDIEVLSFINFETQKLAAAMFLC
ncbi:hypothetical protein [Pedobacter endophyticus]|nr:hypothetical protein [Pedobacter endophyticus]